MVPLSTASGENVNYQGENIPHFAIRCYYTHTPVAFNENKHKICPVEYSLLFGVDVGVIIYNCYLKIIPICFEV